jgi:FkbH-like protein
LDHVRSYLEIYCRLAALVPSFYLGPYGQYAQDILDPASPLYAFAPDVVIAVVHGRALFPNLYDTPLDLDAQARRAAAEAVVDQVGAMLAQLTAKTGALVLWHTFGTPQYSPLGILDLRDDVGQSAIFQAINAGLAERVRREFPSVHLVDEDRIFGRIGKRNVTDPRFWFLARIGIGEGALAALTAEYIRYIKALKGRTRKCLVLDLDNTLWGGVVGEDGPYGVAVGQEAPGNAYRAFQEAILGLWRRGVILAINSKNNEADAMEVLERHPDMLLRPHHFAAIRINWQDKATNLRSIAHELNIGLDSLVFMDDNPAECALVRQQLPEVLTVQLPRDPSHYRGILLELTDFDALHLTEEDRQRGQLYAERRQRQEWEAQHADNLGDHLAALGLVVDVAPADAFAIPRVAQLISKTNQFNLTTRRHHEAAVRAFATSTDHAVYTARVRDRFGDHGLVGVVIIARRDDTWELDTFLLSCRVLGCGVETALLAAISAAARERGARTLRGLFIPTAKNEPARDVYGRHGFVLTSDDDNMQVWTLNLETQEIMPPTWLTLNMLNARDPAMLADGATTEAPTRALAR